MRLFSRGRTKTYTHDNNGINRHNGNDRMDSQLVTTISHFNRSTDSEGNRMTYNDIGISINKMRTAVLIESIIK